MNISEKMKKDWDRRAKHNAKFWIAIDDYASDGLFDESGMKDSLRLLNGLQSYVKPSWKVLEIGCGIGRLLRPLASRFEAVFGVDVSQEMIHQSKLWLKGVPNAMTFENNGVGLSCFTAAYFDFVFSYIAFQHMPKEVVASYLRDINRVLKPQGLLKFQIPLGQRCSPAFEDTISLRVYHEHELTDLLTKNGFRLLEKELIDNGSKNTFRNWFVLAQKIVAVETQSENTDSWLENECRDEMSSSERAMYLLLANNYFQANQGELTINTLKEMCRNSKELVDETIALVNLMHEGQGLESAISFLREIMASNPGNVRLQAHLDRLLKT